MPSPQYERIWRAIRDRQTLAFTYNSKFREVTPVILGYSADRREVLFAYQTGGQTSAGGKLPQWRCFRLDNVTDITPSGEPWTEGCSHRQDQTCVAHVDVDVNIPATLTRVAPLPRGSRELRPPRRGQ